MKVFLKTLENLKNLIPWYVWTCQKYQGTYLILKINMRKSSQEATVFMYKTTSENEFIKKLQEDSKCSLRTAQRVFQEVQQLTVHSVSLQHNRKDVTVIKQSNLRSDLRHKSLFPIG